MSRYASAAAFRASLEERLNAAAREGGRPVGRARKLVAFSRLLARLERVAPDRWILKGGFALELRLAGQARTTRDIDLDWKTSLEDATEVLIEAAALDLDDHFRFEIERIGQADLGAGGGIRFRANALLAGRLFEQLLIDIGIGQTVFPPADRLATPDLLNFADIEPAHVPAAPLEQHLAEKLHAYTRRYGDDNPSSRPKDLVDMVLISELASFEATRLKDVISRLFETRDTHALPDSLAPPPPDWTRPYATLAREVDIDPDPAAGHAQVAGLLDPLLRQELDAYRWNPVSLRWEAANGRA
jgi:predicted nucleotidyltransferase component of viral defense system